MGHDYVRRETGGWEAIDEDSEAVVYAISVIDKAPIDIVNHDHGIDLVMSLFNACITATRLVNPRPTSSI